MIRVFDPEDVCIEEYKSWEDAARAFLKMLNELGVRFSPSTMGIGKQHENYTIDERPSLEELVE